MITTVSPDASRHAVAYPRRASNSQAAQITPDTARTRTTVSVRVPPITISVRVARTIV